MSKQKTELNHFVQQIINAINKSSLETDSKEALTQYFKTTPQKITSSVQLQKAIKNYEGINKKECQKFLNNIASHITTNPAITQPIYNQAINNGQGENFTSFVTNLYQTKNNIPNNIQELLKLKDSMKLCVNPNTTAHETKKILLENIKILDNILTFINKQHPSTIIVLHDILFTEKSEYTASGNAKDVKDNNLYLSVLAGALVTLSTARIIYATYLQKNAKSHSDHNLIDRELNRALYEIQKATIIIGFLQHFQKSDSDLETAALWMTTLLGYINTTAVSARTALEQISQLSILRATSQHPNFSLTPDNILECKEKQAEILNNQVGKLFLMDNNGLRYPRNMSENNFQRAHESNYYQRYYLELQSELAIKLINNATHLIALAKEMQAMGLNKDKNFEKILGWMRVSEDKNMQNIYKFIMDTKTKSPIEEPIIPLLGMGVNNNNLFLYLEQISNYVRIFPEMFPYVGTDKLHLFLPEDDIKNITSPLNEIGNFSDSESKFLNPAFIAWGPKNMIQPSGSNIKLLGRIQKEINNNDYYLKTILNIMQELKSPTMPAIKANATEESAETIKARQAYEALLQEEKTLVSNKFTTIIPKQTHHSQTTPHLQSLEPVQNNTTFVQRIKQQKLDDKPHSEKLNKLGPRQYQTNAPIKANERKYMEGMEHLYTDPARATIELEEALKKSANDPITAAKSLSLLGTMARTKCKELLYKNNKFNTHAIATDINMAIDLLNTANNQHSKSVALTLKYLEEHPKDEQVNILLYGLKIEQTTTSDVTAEILQKIQKIIKLNEIYQDKKDDSLLKIPKEQWRQMPQAEKDKNTSDHTFTLRAFKSALIALGKTYSETPKYNTRHTEPKNRSTISIEEQLKKNCQAATVIAKKLGFLLSAEFGVHATDLGAIQINLPDKNTDQAKQRAINTITNFTNIATIAYHENVPPSPYVPNSIIYAKNCLIITNPAEIVAELEENSYKTTKVLNAFTFTYKEPEEKELERKQTHAANLAAPGHTRQHSY